MKDKKLSSLIGLLALLGVVVFGTLVFKRLPLKVDITEEKLYTLSQGSVNIVSDLSAPVDIKLFFSGSLKGVPPILKTYHQRVKTLLQELQSHSDHLNLEFIDPEPDSDEELLAQRYGITGQPLSHEGAFYFGLVMSNFSGEQTMAYLDFQQENTLEYDLVRNLFLLSMTEKPTLGVLSSLEIIGEEAPPAQFGMPQPPGKPGWLLTEELKQIYDLVPVDASSGSISEDIDLLLVIHLKEANEMVQYAIDQYVMSGRNAIFYVDPYVMTEEQTRNRYQPPRPDRSFSRLFREWGVKYDPMKVVVDPIRAYVQRTPGGVQKIPMVVTLGNENMSDDISTDKLNNLVTFYPGTVDLVPDAPEGVEFKALMTSSEKGQLLDKFKANARPEQILADLKDEGEVYPLGGLFSGAFPSAFEQAPPGAPGTHMAAAAETVHFAVIADVDMLQDDYWAQKMNFFGQTLIQAVNQNTVLLNNMAEKLVGNDDLISLRSRARFIRPFEKVLEKEEEARKKHQAREQELQEKLNKVEEQISTLLRQADPEQKVVLSQKVKEQIDQARQEKVEVAKQLRNVKRDLRRSIDELGSTLQFLNILLVPLLIGLYGIFVLIQRSRRIAP